MNFTAIDFETANEKRGSVIQVGLARVEGGVVVETAVRPVKPHHTLNRFAPRNMAVHGLGSAYVRKASGWPTILDFILDFAGRPTHLVAHNASVERSCIAQACQAWGTPEPALSWLDTMALAKTVMRSIDPGYTSGFGLEPLAARFGVPSFGHHDAGEDARATAELALRIAEHSDAENVHQLWAGTRPLRPRTHSGGMAGYPR